MIGKGMISALSVIGLFSSCMTVGPDYKKPEVAVPGTWSASLVTDQNQPFTGSQRWWMNFKDSSLDKLIIIARKQNPNLQIASSRIIEGWHQRHVLSAAWYPKSELTGRDQYGILNYDRDNIKWDPGASHSQIAQLEMGWEIDLFGRIKRQVESAEAEFESRVEGMRDIGVFIYSEVALHYIAIRTLEKRLNTALESVKIFSRTQEMIKKRNEEGIASKLELAEANARLSASKADVPLLQQELKVVKTRLAAMLGMHPGDIKPLLAHSSGIPTPPRRISVGSPAGLLRSRPDIRRAERKIAAQSARIGVATANLYPQLSISGALSYEYIRRGITVDTLRRTLGLGPNLRWRIFNACADRHRIEENKAQLEQSIVFYEKTILEAVSDVEISITRFDHTKKRYKHLSDASKEYKKAADLMFEAYETGEVDLRRLLNAQRDYIFYKDESFASKGRIAAHSVRLFKSLGGGELPRPGDPKQAQPTHQPKFPADQFSSSKNLSWQNAPTQRTTKTNH